MSEVSYGQQAIDTYLDGMTQRGELLPGAREYLSTRFAAKNEHGGLVRLVGYLENGGMARHGNPERPPTARPEAPLRAIVRRLGGVLHKNEADAVYDEIASEIDPGELQRNPEHVAQRVWETLHQAQHRSRWRTPPALTGNAAKAREAIAAMEEHFRPGVDLDALAHTWRSLGTMQPLEARRIVAKRLGMEMFAKDLTRDGEPVQIDRDEYGGDLGGQPAGLASPQLRAEFARLGNYDVF